MSTERARQTVAERLRAREPEIGDVIFREIRASVPDPVGEDPEYETGLYGAIAEAVGHCLTVIEAGGEGTIPFPPATFEQARRAARHGIGIETLVHRVLLGERMVKGFATTEAGDLPARTLDTILSSVGPMIDRLVLALTEEHRRTRERLEDGPDARRDELIERLLGGDPLTSADEVNLGYPFDGWHLGMVATGPRVGLSLRHLAETLGCSLLLFHSEAEYVSCWLGGDGRLDFAQVQRQPAINRNADALFAVGEPGEGFDGWRRTHEQARLALLPGQMCSGRLTRAAEVLPEVILAKDRPSARLLVATYLSPLDNLRRGGAPARETLRAFFSHDRNVSATAGVLGIARGTVEHRLREVEGAIGEPLHHERLTRIELALKLTGVLEGSDAQ